MDLAGGSSRKLGKIPIFSGKFFFFFSDGLKPPTGGFFLMVKSKNRGVFCRFFFECVPRRIGEMIQFD